MIFFLGRLIIWAAGLLVVGYAVMGFLGYEVNRSYFEQSKTACEDRLRECRQTLIKKGIEGAKENCEFECVEPKLLIQKQENPE